MSSSDEEQFEHIPWERFEAGDQRRRWLVYAGAAALVAGVLSASVTRGLSSSPPVAAPAAPVATPVSIPAPEPEISTTTSTSLLTEADLMAVDPERLAATAAVYAEWFVADYFTIDGTEVSAGEVVRSLPEGSPIPDQGASRSFVESAKAFEVEQLTGDRFRVLVVVRYLTASDGSAYQRMPARAVDLVVAVNGEGASIIDLPSPTALPERVATTPWTGSGGDVPEEIIEAALVRSGGSGKVVEASAIGALWRVVILVEDSGGALWPMSVWLDARGEPAPAGSTEAGL